jgi:hypothetical protein
VRDRADRLGLCGPPVQLAAETSVEDIVATLGGSPRLVIIDSIQTMWTDAAESAPGTVTQVRGERTSSDPLRQALRRGGHPGRTCDQRPASSQDHASSSIWSIVLFRGRGFSAVPLHGR